MSIYNKFQCFPLDLTSKVHNLNTDQLFIMLSNVAPNAATNKVKGDITEIAAGNGYAAGGQIAAFVSGADPAGSYKLVLAPVLFTAAGGNIAAFQYAVLYNKTAAGLNLIGWYDYGTSIIITNGNAFQVSLDQVNGVFTVG